MTQRAEMGFLGQRDADPAVLRAIAAGRRVQLWRSAALESLLDDLHGEEGTAGVHQGNVEVASFLFVRTAGERGGERLEHVQRGGVVGGEEARGLRHALGVAVRHHHSRERLRHGVRAGQVAPRAALAEAADRGVQHFRVVAAHGFVAHAEPGGDAGTEVLDQHVAALRQPCKQRAAFRLLQVERDGALAAVGREVDRGVLADALAERAPPVAGGGLDLEHVGAVLREQHGAVGAGNALRKVEDAQAGVGAVVAGHAPQPVSGLPSASCW